MDQFAQAAVTAAGWPPGSLMAVYDPTVQGGLAKLSSADAALAFVPYPFFVEYAAQLHLIPLAQADVAGIGTKERWTLVAKSGHLLNAASMAGYTIVSVAGYSPELVRHWALVAWQLPDSVKIEPTGQILSALRRVASGEQVAALLDQTQSTALPTLPFAKELQTVLQSPELPVAIVAAVDARLPPARQKSFQAGLLKMGHGPGGADTLGSLRLQGFVMPDLPAHTTAP
jgi:hypothetical protein